MTIGLEVYNDNQHIQITSEYRNLQIVNKKLIKDGEARDSSILRAYQPVGDKFFLIDKPMGSAIAHEIGSASASSSQNIGLQVFDDSGKVVYDSSLKNLRVLDRVKMTGQFNQSGPSVAPKKWSKNYAGKDVAVLVMQHMITGRVYDSQGVLVFDGFSYAFKVSADGTLFCEVRPNGDRFPFPQYTEGWVYFSKHIEFLVIDVTGH